MKGYRAMYITGVSGEGFGSANPPLVEQIVLSSESSIFQVVVVNNDLPCKVSEAHPSLYTLSSADAPKWKNAECEITAGKPHGT